MPIARPNAPTEPVSPAGTDWPPAESWPPEITERLADYVTAMRREADMSQRELSAAAGIPIPTLARIESGATGDPRLSTLTRLASAAGFRLLICDEHAGFVLKPTARWESSRRDYGGRRLPAHLDPETVPEVFRHWWTRRRGQYTFTRRRDYRDLERARRLIEVVRTMADDDQD
jgi:transcriptional regulator with XRE-family HTH domain